MTNRLKNMDFLFNPKSIASGGKASLGSIGLSNSTEKAANHLPPSFEMVSVFIFASVGRVRWITRVTVPTLGTYIVFAGRFVYCG